MMSGLRVHRTPVAVKLASVCGALGGRAKIWLSPGKRSVEGCRLLSLLSLSLEKSWWFFQSSGCARVPGFHPACSSHGGPIML